MIIKTERGSLGDLADALLDMAQTYTVPTVLYGQCGRSSIHDWQTC
jgi:hypothetical protein